VEWRLDGDVLSAAYARRYSQIHTYVFVFSSGRRHTRFKCDWSSDVCSSDLASALFSKIICQRERGREREREKERSEERRVGRECRSRWSPYQYKKESVA